MIKGGNPINCRSFHHQQNYSLSIKNCNLFLASLHVPNWKCQHGISNYSQNPKVYPWHSILCISSRALKSCISLSAVGNSLSHEPRITMGVPIQCNKAPLQTDVHQDSIVLLCLRSRHVGTSFVNTLCSERVFSLLPERCL